MFLNKIVRRIFCAVICLIAVAASADGPATDATLFLDRVPVLGLTIYAEAKITSTNGYLHVVTTNLSLHVWAVTNAATVDAAVSHAAEIIKSEFVKFKHSSTMDVTIAGSSGKHVIGPGNEADDNDPGNAEVVFFSTGGKVFAACVHGEADDASKARPAMMSVLRTAVPWQASHIGSSFP